MKESNSEIPTAALVFKAKFFQDFGGQQSAAGAVLPEQNDHSGLAELLQ